MQIALTRFLKNQHGVFGRLERNGVYECFTLEDPLLYIPCGIYSVALYASPHFQQDVPMLNGVPGRNHIEIHPGNTEHDTEGCILPGLSHDTQGVYESRKAFKHLREQIQQAVAIGEAVSINIQENYNE